ncbi:MAG: hypothetical protein ACYS8Z_23460 [Planctomycetota bacterium]|jgi:hypothetical protein
MTKASGGSRSYLPVAFQTISLADSTALALNSTMQTSAQVLDISVETNNARYRFDSTAPTVNTGVVLWAGNTYRWEGYNGGSTLKFQRDTGTCVLSVQGYKLAGLTRAG